MDNNYNNSNYSNSSYNSNYSNSSYSSNYDYGSYNPYQQVNQAPQKPLKKKGGFGSKLAKCAAIALVFGLIAGCTFTGVTYVGSKALGINTTEKSNSGLDYNQNQESSNQDVAVQPTVTGLAKELTDVSDIFEEVQPSIVAITNTETVVYQSFWGPQKRTNQSCGSGIIVQQDDKYIYIVTNNHVVENSDTLMVQFFDNTTVSSEIRGTVPANDLAVVRVAIDSINADTLKNIKLASIGDSNELKVGNPAIAIGNALGFGQSLTCGHISALGRTVTLEDNATKETIVITNMIQTTAAINPGNSGGALLNAQGQVIGINSSKYVDSDVEGMGYAIAISDAMPLVNQLIENGKVTEPETAYLGIQGEDISADIAATFNMPEGVYIYKVFPDSAAADAEIRQGDIITAFNGVNVRTMQELKAQIARCSVGQEVTVKIHRLGNGGYEARDIQVTLGAMSGSER